MLEKEKLQLLIDYIEGLGGEIEEYELTTDKIRDRAEFLNDPERPDWIVFELDRHCGILLTFWEPGKPMDAFITYFPRYAFHPASKKFEYLGRFRESEYDIHEYVYELYVEEVYDLSFEVTQSDNNQLLCRESCGGYEKIIRNEQELQHFAVQISQQLGSKMKFEELEEYLNLEQNMEINEKLKENLEKVARHRAQIAWDRYYRNS